MLALSRSYARHSATRTSIMSIMSIMSTVQQSQQQQTQQRCFSWDGHGTDLLSDSLSHHDGIPKIVLHAHGPSGFDVGNAVKNLDRSDMSLMQSRGIVHYAGSILCFPTSCYLWKVQTPAQLTPESLAPVQLLIPSTKSFTHPKNTSSSSSSSTSNNAAPPMTTTSSSRLEYLFLGSSLPIAPHVVDSIRKSMPGIVVEAMDLPNAMGTFNVLNAEDRMVAAALMLPPSQQ
eukprot:Nitzschia sp. Nitz4//scaffold22_size323478//119013//119705//NITZ4_000522-RA/size323478-processed-gene-0.456-mRNA-1//-1//CDS//3329542980//787//frame0